VHRNLGLPKAANDMLLCLVELLALRSGHAYQAAHLHHHVRYPYTDDIEATAARQSFWGALGEGPTFQLRIWWWALRHVPRVRAWVVGEGMAVLMVASLAAIWMPLLVYAVLVVIGSWIIPPVTSYVPHEPDGKNELVQTRAFRGRVLSVVALEHLYHLEHHLYPAVPHHNWPRLAKRLDPYLTQAGVVPVRLWF
jgi:beta-carotene hydroxylase